MNVRRGGLGRGLGALIPTGPVTEEGTAVGARFEEVAVELIDPNPRQPREVFDEDALAELVASIREVGVLQPVVVREVEGGRYQLIMGERRLRASKAAGLDHVPAIVRETPDDALLRDALLENLHRQQLNPLEEAAAYQQLLNEFGATHEELADRIGRSRSHVSNTLRLMNLSGPVQRRVAAGVLSAGHARALLAIEEPGRQDALAARIVAEGLSVRAVEEIVTAPQEPPSPIRERRERPSAPRADELAARLQDALETRVRIDLGKRRGKITVEFATLDDLERIAALLLPSSTAAVQPDGEAVNGVVRPDMDGGPEETGSPEMQQATDEGTGEDHSGDHGEENAQPEAEHHQW